MPKARVAVSIGDLNGIGVHIALLAHNRIKGLVDPLYVVHPDMLRQAAKRLCLSVPGDMRCVAPDADVFNIQPGTIDAQSGAYSYASFAKAVELARCEKVDAVCTLPIHKKAWELAGIAYKGHTDALRDFFDQEAVMMLGCAKMYVALFTEHIPLKEVPRRITKERLTRFLIDVYRSVTPDSPVAVLGLNPHAGDGGVLGDEERIIKQSIDEAAHILQTTLSTHYPLPSPLFDGPLVPDIAFTPHIRKRYRYFVAMYHDQGLAPLKALYFDESINVSLNLPILRTSVDHGTAFDIAYKRTKISIKSYENAIGYIAERKKR